MLLRTTEKCLFYLFDYISFAAAVFILINESNNNKIIIKTDSSGNIFVMLWFIF